MRQLPVRTIGRLAILGLFVLASASCGTTSRESRASSFLVIDQLSAASGAKPGEFGNVLQSDVVTVVKIQGGGTTNTVYEDNGQVTLRFAMKDPVTPAGVTTNNEITVTGYHVQFYRADGRNTPGVDVPYAFDGGMTGTTKTGIAITLGFTLVRAQAKLEAPLLALRGMGGQMIISTMAEVTFYGHDLAGNQVSVTGTMSVNFADWADANS
jgi:hypothetical protein